MSFFAHVVMLEARWTTCKEILNYLEQILETPFQYALPTT